MAASDEQLEILLPVYNEAGSIEGTIREIYDALSERVSPRFIVCEDGSTDETKPLLLNLSRAFPIKLIMSDERKGYSRAVIDGMKSLTADYLLVLDSDGQCDPHDFGRFWDARHRQDVAIGWRVSRSDSLLRKGMSRAFYHVYQLFYRVPIHDPSCPFVLARRRVIDCLVPELGEMKQGFWWEFTARAHRRGYSIREFPIHHRIRSAGTTQVYRLRRLPDIAYRHFVALFKIWQQSRKRA